MFKLIAIQTLISPVERYQVPENVSREGRFEIDLRKARRASVMKVLHDDEWYWLTRGYRLDGERLVPTDEGLPNDFYSGSGPYISFSAIVGENGTGKSSLLELFFRLVNNVSYALRDALLVQRYVLHFVRDIYARAWMQDDEGIFFIEQQDGNIRIHWQDGQVDEFQYDYDTDGVFAEDAAAAREWLKKLFYTIVVNYSQYAYNTNDYLPEWDEGDTGGESQDSLCWLKGLFHKNDGYQTPIVLNPFRENGNININQERDLTHNRLYYLVLNDASPLKQILRKKEAKAFIFDIDIDLNPVPSKRYYSQRVVKLTFLVLTLGTMSVTTAVVADMHIPALGTHFYMAAKGTGTAMRHVSESSSDGRYDLMLRKELISMTSDNLTNVKFGPHRLGGKMVSIRRTCFIGSMSAT